MGQPHKQYPARSDTHFENHSWNRAARSPLARQILLGLGGVALIEFACICCIGYCLFQSAAAAEREFNLLQSSSQLVNVLKDGRELWAQATRLRRNVIPSEYEAYRKEYAQLLAQVDLVSAALQKAQVDADIVTDARNTLRELDVQTETIYRRKMHGVGGDVDYQSWKIPSMTSLEQSVKLVDRVHEIIRQHSQDAGQFEQTVWLILVCSAAANLMIVVYGYRAIRSRLTLPIVNLASNCDRILQGEVIPPTNTQAINEITGLERTFRLMSIDLSENTKRRKNFQNLFRDVLMAGLVRIDNSLSTALQNPPAEVRSLVEKSVERCKKSLSPLIAMLDSLSQSLASETEEDLRIVLKPAQLRAIVEQSILAVESLANEKAVIVTQQTAAFTATLDEHLIRRILINLLSNAIKFSAPKGEIEISVQEDDAWWQMSVRDHGRGIPEQAKDRLFTRFCTLHKASDQPRDGTGLGLVICKQIVEAHGGTIWCDSVVGSGTTFSIRVPKEVHPEPAKSSSPIENAQPEIRTGTDKTRHHIAHYFTALLLALVGVQAGIMTVLNLQFNEIHKQAARFSAQKDGLIASQNTLSKLLQDRYDVIEACMSGDITAASQIIRALEPAIDRIKASLGPEDSQADSIVQSMASSVKGLSWLAEGLPKKPEQQSKLQLAKFFQPAKTIYDQLEENCFTLMNVQQSKLESSFALTAQLRNQIAAVIALTLLCDLSIFALAARRTLTLIDRTKHLADKAQAFTEGTTPEPSDASAGDELSLLEERFCRSANQLQAIEDRRQS
ncbi:MAG TPA: HAMP domain-containing sensor histidine kinase, partial [Trichormus sp.]